MTFNILDSYDSSLFDVETDSWILVTLILTNFFICLQSYRTKSGRGGGNSNQSQGPATPQQTPSSGTVTPQPTTHPPGGPTIVALNGNDPPPNATMMTTTDHSVSKFHD